MSAQLLGQLLVPWLLGTSKDNDGGVRQMRLRAQPFQDFKPISIGQLKIEENQKWRGAPPSRLSQHIDRLLPVSSYFDRIFDAGFFYCSLEIENIGIAVFHEQDCGTCFHGNYTTDLDVGFDKRRILRRNLPCFIRSRNRNRPHSMSLKLWFPETKP
jgi:hypothetical protein